MSDELHSASELRFRYLIEVFCNSAATDCEFAELEQCLSRDAAARAYYRRSMNLESALRDFAENAAGVSAAGVLQATTPRAERGQSLLSIVAMALFAVAALVWFWSADKGQQPLPQRTRVIGVLDELTGSIAIAGSDGDVRTAHSGAELKSGDTVRTPDSQSAATLVYADGTRLSLAGKSSVTLNGDEPKNITVHGGVLFASVTPQPAGRPMRIATHTDSLEILGTRFTLDVSRQQTDVAVTEGHVRLTRSSDGKSVEVPAGQRVVSSARSKLALKEIPPAPDEWREDFESGLPDEWGAGKLVAAGLPLESQTAVQSVPVPSKDGEPFEIATADQWAHGLFAIHDDSHLHFTFKMRNPGWLNILILTRTADGHPPTFAGNYLFDEAGWWPVRADQWATVRIPLTAFRPLPPARGGFENAVPFQVLFSSPQGDRGLVIDQISVKRGGPGVVMTKEFPQ